ncbi:hypothetical protein HDU98_002772 [Podochytrium sp. JEL0797]|nr:hypothetical protein HDU98_002772 [Podochytrium sp. JEL0797]
MHSWAVHKYARLHSGDGGWTGVGASATGVLQISEGSVVVTMDNALVEHCAGSKLALLRKGNVIGFKFGQGKAKSRFQVSFGNAAFGAECEAACSALGAKTRSLDTEATANTFDTQQQNMIMDTQMNIDNTQQNNTDHSLQQQHIDNNSQQHNNSTSDSSRTSIPAQDTASTSSNSPSNNASAAFEAMSPDDQLAAMREAMHHPSFLPIMDIASRLLVERMLMD